MKVGLLHLADSSWGGLYQYSLSAIQALVKNDQETQYVVIGPESDGSSLPQDADAAVATGSVGAHNEDQLAHGGNGYPWPGVVYDSLKIDGCKFVRPSLSHQ